MSVNIIKDTDKREIKRRKKTIEHSSNITWLVIQICVYNMNGNRDVVYMILTTLISLFGCHTCHKQVIRRSINDMNVCDNCQTDAHHRIYRHSFDLIDEMGCFMSCSECKINKIPTCYYCNYTTCLVDEDIDSHYSKKYDADGYSKALSLVATYHVSYITLSEKFIIQCNECDNLICYKCRKKYCKIGYSSFDFAAYYIFLCHRCNSTQKL